MQEGQQIVLDLYVAAVHKLRVITHCRVVSVRFAELAGVDLEVVAEVGLSDESVVYRREPNGFGAPRAFDVTVLRKIGFPNVSYGEDYAIGLRISREYEIGRLYEPAYLCRRWEGNSDSALPLETANRYDFYKDWLRSNEIRARQRMNTGHKND